MRSALLLAVLAAGCSASGAKTTDKYGWRVGVTCTGDSCGHGFCMSSTGKSRCICKSGFTGVNCDEDIDECSKFHQCKEGSTCVNVHGHYKCQCAEGQTGWRCHIKSANCTRDDQCKNGGRCVNRSCVCQPDFEGSTCEEEFEDFCKTYEPCSSDEICVQDRTRQLGYACKPAADTAVRSNVPSTANFEERTFENTDVAMEPELASTDSADLKEQLAACRFRGNAILSGAALLIVLVLLALAVRTFRRRGLRCSSEDSGQFVNVKFERMSSVSMESSINEQP